jgi:hypothetical protein
MNRRSRGSLARDSVAFLMRTTLRERTLLCKRNIAPKMMDGSSKVVDVAAAPAADTITINNFNIKTTSFLKLKSGLRF